MKSTETIKEFRAMSPADLRAAKTSAERELLNLRFRHSAGQLEQSAQLKNLRRRIARAMTIHAQKVRGDEPKASAKAVSKTAAPKTEEAGAETPEKKKRTAKKAPAAKGKK